MMVVQMLQLCSWPQGVLDSLLQRAVSRLQGETKGYIVYNCLIYLPPSNQSVTILTS